jgi:hypothetical protein
VYPEQIAQAPVPHLDIVGSSHGLQTWSQQQQQLNNKSIITNNKNNKHMAEGVYG